MFHLIRMAVVACLVAAWQPAAASDAADATEATAAGDGAGDDSTTPATDTLETDAGPVTLHAIQHATCVLTFGNHTIIIDPTGGAEPFAEHEAPDLILITDIHSDHLNAETIAAIATEQTTVVAPAAAAKALGEDTPARVLGNGEVLEWEDVKIEAVPMYNLTAERQDFHPKGRGNGYVLGLGGSRFYISGDTEDIPEMRALESIDAALICMNLPYTMDVDHAAAAVLEFAPRVVYPYHYRGKGMISDVERFRELVAANDAIDVRLLKWY